jgi:2-dehydro-3-deoxygluconokinase
MSQRPTTRIAAIGECMIELSEHPDGRITRSFGGDTLNTAVYLARLGAPVDYITALGDDAFSNEMIAGWRAEGVGTDHVQRMIGRVPGLYMIQTDAKGERRFSYWRDRAPAREIFATSETERLCAHLATYSHIYFSGISLSLYGEAGRARFFAALQVAKQCGTIIAFDTNYRARGWPVREEAIAAYNQALLLASIVFASVEDLVPLYGDAVEAELLKRTTAPELILKLREPAAKLLRDSNNRAPIPAAPVPTVVDTTAAGDSFAAAYLAARIKGLAPHDAILAGHHLARVVVQHRGAIIPRAVMPPPFKS